MSSIFKWLRKSISLNAGSVITEKYPHGSPHEYVDLKLAFVIFHFETQKVSRDFFEEPLSCLENQ